MVILITKKHKQKSGVNVVGVRVNVEEGRFERGIRLFNKKVQEEGIIKEVRAREFYEKPTAKRKRERAMAKKRWIKKYSLSNPTRKKHF